MKKNLQIPSRFPAQLLDRVMFWGSMQGEMIIQLEMEFSEQLDAGKLAKAAELTLDAEPILGCRFVPHWRKPHWERMNSGSSNVFSEAKTEDEFESFKVASLDAYIGPQFLVCLWNYDNGARLLLKVSHYIADATGVKDVARIISSIYSRLSQDTSYHPEPNIHGSRSAWQVLKYIPKRRYVSLYFRFLPNDSQNNRAPERTLTLPLPEGQAESLSFLNRSLPHIAVSNIVEYGKRNKATINDLLLAAFFRALASTARWDGHEELRVTSTIDLRRYIPIRQASAVANLSVWADGWPNLGTDLGQDFSSTLGKITSMTQRYKQNFGGIDTLMGVLVGLGPSSYIWAMNWVKRSYQKRRAKGKWAHAFTNTGPINPTAVTFESKPVMARLLPPPSYPPLFALGISGYEGTLTLSTGVYSIQRDLAGCFLDKMVAELPS
jgi:NRPS condensation-like uncharacterized protein